MLSLLGSVLTSHVPYGCKQCHMVLTVGGFGKLVLLIKLLFFRNKLIKFLFLLLSSCTVIRKTSNIAETEFLSLKLGYKYFWQFAYKS